MLVHRRENCQWFWDCGFELVQSNPSPPWKFVKVGHFKYQWFRIPPPPPPPMKSWQIWALWVSVVQSTPSLCKWKAGRFGRLEYQWLWVPSPNEKLSDLGTWVSVVQSTTPPPPKKKIEGRGTWGNSYVEINYCIALGYHLVITVSTNIW